MSISGPLREIIDDTRVIPVVTIDRLEDAFPLAEALVEGGLPVIEVTLRTPAALPAIAGIAKIGTARVGAGTLLSPSDVLNAREAGACFGVAPGCTQCLVDATRQYELPFMPGVATASEAMRALEAGLEMQKFFPAKASGGPRTLAALAAPLPQIRFCPTGGVDAANAADYLDLTNVVCVGGSWMVPPHAIASKDWGAIHTLAQAAASL